MKRHRKAPRPVERTPEQLPGLPHWASPAYVAPEPPDPPGTVTLWVPRSMFHPNPIGDAVRAIDSRRWGLPL